MAATVAMLIGGAVVNALAFSGSNYLFSRLRDNKKDTERIRHDKAVEQLQKARDIWDKKRIERLDWLETQRRRENHAVATFRQGEESIREYDRVLGPRPKLSDFYTPNQEQKDNEILFVTLGMGVVGLITYYGIIRRPS